MSDFAFAVFVAGLVVLTLFLFFTAAIGAPWNPIVKLLWRLKPHIFPLCHRCGKKHFWDFEYECCLGRDRR